jgi:hypothetical protein
MAAYDDLANSRARETFLAGVGLDRDLLGCQARKAAGGPHPRLVLDPETIVEVDSKCEVLKGLKRLGVPERRRQQHESNGQDD